MSKAYPSLLALLGLVAVAGYQNRDKLGKMASRTQTGSGALQPAGNSSGGNSFMKEVSQMFGGAGAGGALVTGLQSLVSKFRDAGQSDVADSWVSRGPNRQVETEELRMSLGDDLIAELSARTGVGADELLQRLGSVLPEAVDRFTPEGRIPTEAETSALV